MKTLIMLVATALLTGGYILHAQPGMHHHDMGVLNIVPQNPGIVSPDNRTADNVFDPVYAGKRMHNRKSVLSGGWVQLTYYSQIWVKGAWVNEFLVNNTYDEAGNHTGSVEQRWNDTTDLWVTVLVESWTYDSVGNSIMYLESDWTGSQWATLRILSTFNADGYETNSLLQWLDNGTWVDSGLDSITYDTNGHPISDWQRLWSGGAWVNAHLITATYDTNGYETSLLYQNWYGGAWVNYERWSYTYDGNGNTSTVLGENWIHSAWVNSTLDSYTYDGNDRLTTKLEMAWSGGAWVNSIQDSYTNDANGNNTGILEENWKLGAWVNAWLVERTWQKLSILSIAAPAQGDKILAGSMYGVRWRAAGYTSLNIEYSLDSGRTYLKMANNVPADPNSYHWHVPDTLSAKCRIRIRDANDSTQSTEGGLFKIKPYILTRFKQNGDYEPFDLALHAWQFANDSTYMWPKSWWSQFDYYFGTDPYTNKPYPPVFVFPPVMARDSNFIDWPLFVKTFMPAVCYNNVSGAVYSPTALKLWSHYKDPNFRGSCFGFSQSCLLAFDRPSQFQAVYPEVGNFQNIHDRELNDSLKNLINQLYEHQYGYQHELVFHARYLQMDARMSLEELKSYFLSDTIDHRGLSIINQNGRGGHSIVPYKLDRVSDDGFFLLEVYDNNAPSGTYSSNGAPTRVRIDSSVNAWDYPPLGFGGTYGLLLDDPASTYLAPPILWSGTFPQMYPHAASPGKTPGTSAYLSVYTTISSAITITDSTGHTIGYHDSVSYNNLGDGIPIVPLNSFQQPPIGYFIPDGPYSIQTTSFTRPLSESSVLNQTGMFTYWRSDAANNQTDRLSYNNGIAVGNPDPAVKSVNLEAITRLPGSEHDFQILNCPLTQNDSAGIATPTSDQVEFINLGPSKVYDLTIVLAGTNASGRFTHTGITVPAHSTHYIVPNWPDLTQPVKIFEDVGNVGSIHDTLSLANQTTGVMEQPKSGLPSAFALEQNYPNPFNPVTTIRYALPKESPVVLRVYNVLGQQVATLVNEVEQPGYRSVSFDGSKLQSGVYFYRIEAGTFVQTRKLILLK